MHLMAPAGLLELARQTLDRLALPMQNLSDRYARFSLRRDTGQPNLEVHVPFPAFRTLDARQYFEALRTLARILSERD
jgi:hypothetical protein